MKLRQLRQQQGFESLTALALKLNDTTDRLIELLAKMEQLNRELRANNFNPLTVDVTMTKLPYYDVLIKTIRVRNRSSVIQTQLVRAKNQ